MDGGLATRKWGYLRQLFRFADTHVSKKHVLLALSSAAHRHPVSRNHLHNPKP